jgi:hypothetical protein
MLRQDGRCADCGTRLILGFFVFDHRPPLALRDATEDANDPGRLAAICWQCDQEKTPKDLAEIARAKRLADKHQDFLARQRDKVPGRRTPTRKELQRVQKFLARESDGAEETIWHSAERRAGKSADPKTGWGKIKNA